MAIIRIKRTTGTVLPTGLTFGEMAYVQGSGATANRLYIANNAGVCVWVGAQILNSPTFWSGLTAQTTVPTIDAVERRYFEGGTFAGDIPVNIDVGKYFGKYKKGDIIPATNRTLKWVIEDALQEKITPYADLTATPSSNIPFGQTTGISYTLTARYNIRTMGATAAGATLEWKRGNDSTWTAYATAGSFYDITSPFATAGVTFTVTAQGVTTNGTFPATAYNTNTFQYRYSVHDTEGMSFTTAITTINVDGYGADPSAGLSATAVNLQAAETNAVRERGNSYSDITGTISQKSTLLPLTFWKLQHSINGGAFTDTNRPSAGWQTATNPTTTINTNHNPGVAGMTSIAYRIQVTDTYRIQQGTTATVTPTGQPGVSFGHRLFYGPTAVGPIDTVAKIKSLPGVSFARGTLGIGIPFILNTGTAFRNFVVCIPTDMSIVSVVDYDALGGQDITGSYILKNDWFNNEGGNTDGTFNYIDREGAVKRYRIYRFEAAVAYTANKRHGITLTGNIAAT